MVDLELATTPTPRYALAGTLGRVRVLSYHRNGYFFVLASGCDTPFYRHRSALRFLD